MSIELLRSMPSTVVISIPETEYQKLKIILEEEHGKEFSIEDIREIADNLVELYILLNKSVAGGQY